ncbi:uncharacterized protein FSUBG_3713 [Fusarium subglutinans]|uniref:Uncharacterized protein n=1 Tax=Gibberella subglutinans TaxID=42677 RepID=A0A8H5V3T2_GIBSU|nr:uncharacterized protein FSUBG_3713 [Fusarium subglutinans]KAF5609932.1 hypothetical protein FSUBG_3713 [Fusarium subglutinans]
MFRPKEPFEGQETIDAHLIGTSDEGTSVLSSQCVKFAKDRPDDFTNYLLCAWKRDGAVIREHKELLKALQNVEVTRKDGETSLLREFYLPLPKLVFLQARYMLPHETFKFLDLDPKLSSSTDLGPWIFLRDDIKVEATDDEWFYLSLLHYVQTQNSDGKVEFPRRVFELYLRLQAVCEAGGERIKVEVRNWLREQPLILTPSGWKTASQCYVKAPRNPSRVISDSTLLPPPKEWEVSSFERPALEKFYRETLEVLDGEVESILLEFGKEPDFKRAKQLYHALQTMEPGLTNDDIKRIRSFFKDKPRLLLSEKSTERFLSTECVWAPKFTSPRNASETCPELESFFTELLGVSKTDINVVYQELVDFDYRMMLDPYDSLDEKIKRLLIQLSERLPQFGHLIDKEDLREKQIFPVYGKDKRVRLFPVSKLFYILDKEYLHHSFRGKADVLDIDHTTFWLLEPFFIWMGLQSRYLRNNLIMEPASITPGVVNYESTPTLDQERVDGLLRLAVHFRSSRTRNAEEIASVERQLLLTKVYYVDEGDIKCTVSIKGLPSTTYKTPFPPFCINKRRNNGLNIYVAKKSAEVTTSVELPRSLAAWLMGDRDPRHPDTTQVDPRLIYLVGTILRVRHYKLSAIKDILDGEGIVDVDKLQCSIYHPQSWKQEYVQLFSAQPPSLMSSRSTLDSSRTSTPAQVDGLTRHTSFGLGGKSNSNGFGSRLEGN